MPTAPDSYNPPSVEESKNIESFNKGRKRDDEHNRYAHRRYRKFRSRIKKQRRAIDEERIHDIYQQLEQRSFREYMLWLEDDNPLCVDCLDKGILSPGRVMDHIMAIEQGGAVYDEDNLQFLCDTCHNRKSGKESHSEKSMVRIITGAPGSGKTTYVKNHVRPGDLVFDLDEIYRALSFQPLYQKPDELKDIVFRVRDRVYRSIRESNDIRRAWIIVSYPEASKRTELKNKLNGHLYLIDCPAELCKQRIRQQQRPGTVDWDKVVDSWYDRFEPMDDEQVINYNSQK